MERRAIDAAMLLGQEPQYGPMDEALPPARPKRPKSFDPLPDLVHKMISIR